MKNRFQGKIRDFYFLFVLLLLLGGVTVSGCYYDKEEELYPPGTSCDTTNVRYTNDIASLLSNRGCVGCHGSSGGSGGVGLANYNDVKTHALNGRLYGALTHASGYTAMPPSGPKFDDCTLQRIQKWIARGAPEN